MTFLIYLIGTFDNVTDAVVGISILSIFVTCMFCSIWYMSEDIGFDGPDEKVVSKIKKLLKTVIYSGLSAIVLCSLIPNSKTIAAMYVIPKIANNEKLQQIGSKGVDDLLLLTQKYEQKLLKGDKNDS